MVGSCNLDATEPREGDTPPLSAKRSSPPTHKFTGYGLPGYPGKGLAELLPFGLFPFRNNPIIKLRNITRTVLSGQRAAKSLFVVMARGTSVITDCLPEGLWNICLWVTPSSAILSLSLYIYI